MTPTQERIKSIASACEQPDVQRLMGRISEQALTAWITSELGHVAALDAFQPHGPLLSRAIAPPTILHIVSGNTPHSALQNLVRGMLLGSHNCIKIPSSGLPELIECVEAMPRQLKPLVSIHTELTDDHWQAAQAVIATGSDTTIAAIQRKILPHQIFIPHGHKVSIGIVFDDYQQAAALAAKDISVYNQQGCLSPHAVYVRGDATRFAELLAGEMDSIASSQRTMSLSDAGAVRNLRETTRFLAANDGSTKLWESSNNLDWTVVYESSPELKLSCLNRCVYVKPLPDPLDTETLGKEAAYLSTIAIHPYCTGTAKSLSHMPAHRICPLGQSQQPSLFWHHDGFAPLASLVKWKDIG